MPCWPNWSAWRRSWRISIGSSRPSSSKKVDLSCMRLYPIRTMKAILTLVSLATLFLTSCVLSCPYSYDIYNKSYRSSPVSGYTYHMRPYQTYSNNGYVQVYNYCDPRIVRYSTYKQGIMINSFIPRTW